MSTLLRTIKRKVLVRAAEVGVGVEGDTNILKRRRDTIDLSNRYIYIYESIIVFAFPFNRLVST